MKPFMKFIGNWILNAGAVLFVLYMFYAAMILVSEKFGAEGFLFFTVLVVTLVTTIWTACMKQ